MLLQKEQNQNQIKIKGYKNRQINVSGKLYDTPILINASELSLFNQAKQFSELTAGLLLPMLPEGTEIIISIPL